MHMVVQSMRTLLVLSVLTGIIYPLGLTAVSRLAFPRQASGSLVRDGSRIVGSALIGQPFSSPRYFWGRPSATAPVPYDAGASSGSNYGPLNPALRQVAEARVEALRAAGQAPDRVPADLLTASGSGLDPHVSPAAAYVQVDRVAAARGIDPGRVRALVDVHVEPRTFGMLGEPRVNVLSLNLALDSLP